MAAISQTDLDNFAIDAANAALIVNGDDQQAAIPLRTGGTARSLRNAAATQNKGDKGDKGDDGTPGTNGTDGTTTPNFVEPITIPVSETLTQTSILDGYVYTIQDEDGQIALGIDDSGSLATNAQKLNNPSIVGGTATGLVLSAATTNGPNVVANESLTNAAALDGLAYVVMDSDDEIALAIDLSGNLIVGHSPTPLQLDAVEGNGWTAHTELVGTERHLYFESKATQVRKLLVTTPGDITKLRTSFDGTKLIWTTTSLLSAGTGTSSARVDTIPPPPLLPGVVYDYNSMTVSYNFPWPAATCGSYYYDPVGDKIHNTLATVGILTVYGDSLTGAGVAQNTRGFWPEVVTDTIGQGWICDIQGVGGQTSTSIAARQGGYPILITLANNMLLEGSASSVTNINCQPITQGNAASINSGVVGSNIFNGTMLGRLVQLYGDGNGNYTVTCLDGNPASIMPAGTQFIIDTQGRDSNLQVFIMGQNDPPDDASKAAVVVNIQMCIANLKSLGKRYLVINSPYSQSLYNQIKAAFPANLVVDVRAALFAANGTPWDGVTWDGAFANIPQQYEADGIHFNIAGQAIWGAAVLASMRANNWV
jgi:lysophospholipase L1-like esterase